MNTDPLPEITEIFNQTLGWLRKRWGQIDLELNHPQTTGERKAKLRDERDAIRKTVGEIQEQIKDML
jgi:hypothetical protein